MTSARHSSAARYVATLAGDPFTWRRITTSTVVVPLLHSSIARRAAGESWASTVGCCLTHSTNGAPYAAIGSTKKREHSDTFGLVIHMPPESKPGRSEVSIGSPCSSMSFGKSQVQLPQRLPQNQQTDSAVNGSGWLLTDP